APGETVGRLRLSVPRAAIPFVIDPLVPTFRARHPRIEVEVAVEDRLVDVVAEGDDAGVRLTESIERGMVQGRLTGPFLVVVVGAPSYFAKRGTPERPQDLLRHECITFPGTSFITPVARSARRRCGCSSTRRRISRGAG